MTNWTQGPEEPCSVRSDLAELNTPHQRHHFRHCRPCKCSLVVTVSRSLKREKLFDPRTKSKKVRGCEHVWTKEKSGQLLMRSGTNKKGGPTTIDPPFSLNPNMQHRCARLLPTIDFQRLEISNNHHVILNRQVSPRIVRNFLLVN